MKLTATRAVRSLSSQKNTTASGDRRRVIGNCIRLSIVLAALVLLAIQTVRENPTYYVSSLESFSSATTSRVSNAAAGEAHQDLSTPVWPGIPSQEWNRQAANSSETAFTNNNHNKLVRIGDGGILHDVRQFIRDENFHFLLEEFLPVYLERPDRSNTCGIRFSHSLAIYTIAKRLNPTTIVESGVNAGQSTYFLRKACPQAKIISIDPEIKPICGQPERWIDDTNNEYLTGPDHFVDFDEVNWKERLISPDKSAGGIDPERALVFFDDHRGFYPRMATLVKYGFRHIVNEDNYKLGEGATRFDKAGWTPKQMFQAARINGGGNQEQKKKSMDAQWLYYNSIQYAEFPPLLPPLPSPHPKKVQGAFLHHTDDLEAIEEPILRPDVDSKDADVFQQIAHALKLNTSLEDSESYQEFMGYCFLSYTELAPLGPLLKAKWGLDK